ncbi:hydrolase [Thioclava dalianensis]|uniref:phosphoglycolate phosphatase n=1 Tax=Thioclava dalianensis TaxID=1185766 RepID=A0A074TET6_9RHOB|nr:HAD family phosphatase [Thioclava dalianensis]KEP68675.1 hydrolase [Thioclava dalianensis]SFM94795.1 haloacid dehalogenase superfamily, subfamily IA, variant 3 with third motif having DD or ED [Thioclava dalianensis]
MKVRAVLFDCDGVLVDSESQGFALMQEELAAYGLPLSLEALETSFVGGTIEDVATRARDRGARLPEDWVEQFYAKLYQRLGEGTDLIPGIADLLDRLDAAGIVYGVGSNGRTAKMEVTLGQHPDIRARFEGRMFSGQELGCPKPDPGLYLHVARALKTDPAQCVVIEDSPTGARGAQAAGIRCLGYAPHGTHAALEAAGATLFTDMAQVPGLIGLD